MLVRVGRDHQDIAIPMEVLFARIGWYGRLLLFFALLSLLFTSGTSEAADDSDDDSVKKLVEGMKVFTVLGVIGVILNFIISCYLISISGQGTKASVVKATYLCYTNIAYIFFVKFGYYVYFCVKFEASGYFSWVFGCIFEIWITSNILKICKLTIEQYDAPEGTGNIPRRTIDAMERAINNEGGIGSYAPYTTSHAPTAEAEYAPPNFNQGPPVAYASAEVYPQSGTASFVGDSHTGNVPPATATAVKADNSLFGYGV